MRALPLLVLVAVVGVLAVYATDRPTGDGGEYLLEMHAFGTHGTWDIRAGDATWLRARAPSLRGVAHDVVAAERHDAPGSVATRRATNGAYYAGHFWFYSLLAVPFLGVTELVGAAPTRALGVVNGLAAAFGALALWLHFGRGRFGLAAALSFVLAGTTFYLGWTGPEALTAAATVVACVLARHGKLGAGLTAAAVASLQNASAAALLPYVVWCWWRRRQRVARSDLLLAAAATLLTLLPYAFYYAHFRIPSLTGHFATDPALIGFERAWSFVFDLNQGLVLGMPGVLVALCVAVVLAVAKPPARRSVAVDVASTLALVTVMALPTLSVHNWNAGNSVIIRYGYWVAMPLLVLTLELARSLGPRARTAVMLTFGVLQVAAIAPNGVFGERYSYLRQSWAAAAVLRRFPGVYNPVPEIFFERSLGREVPFSTASVVAWPAHGSPVKLLVRSDRPPRNHRVCPAGVITSTHVHPSSGGWAYLDRPFRCDPNSN